MFQRPVVLCILDGMGLGKGAPDDAVATARTPNLTRWMATRPWVRLQAHGTAVGMPSDEDLGNSEVGHNAMGAGRVFDQGAKLVNRAIASGEAWKTDCWRQLASGQTLHLIGLWSDGNVHSHVDHVNAILQQAEKDGVRRIRLHLLTDGRDVPRRSALTYLQPLEERLASARTRGMDYQIASGGGRMAITMDRYEADWPMVARGWNCHVHGEGRAFPSAIAAVEALYAENPEGDDQYLPAFVITDHNGPVGRIVSGDSVLFFNFRGDRAIEITRAFQDPRFDKFERGPAPEVFFAGIMQYDGDLGLPTNYLVSPPEIDGSVGEHLAAAGRTTCAISETQKFGHVTYFFNGNRSEPFDAEKETYLQIPSDNVPFNERPWMKAAEIIDAAIHAVQSGRYDHVRLNLPNGDMVGHTGDLEATRIAVETVDLQLGRLEKVVFDAGGVLLVTADHGNADEMWSWEKGKLTREADGRPRPRTAHTVHPVPFILVDPAGKLDLRRDLKKPGLASIGTTLLQLLEVPIPSDYVPGLIR